ncbi:MAG TPA: hypothetical protein PL064_14160, partial [Thermogutta sp.]|nr:hypothetical protein [Thermogutta sp.]
MWTRQYPDNRRQICHLFGIWQGMLIVLVTFGITTVAVGESAGDGQVIFAVIRGQQEGKNLLAEGTWGKYEQGFEEHEGVIVCENKDKPGYRAGAVQSIVLNQKEPRPLVAVAESAAQDVDGARDNNYSVYLDIEYNDGTPLWGQAAAFDVGTHDWQ